MSERHPRLAALRAGWFVLGLVLGATAMFLRGHPRPEDLWPVE